MIEGQCISYHVKVTGVNLEISLRAGVILLNVTPRHVSLVIGLTLYSERVH